MKLIILLTSFSLYSAVSAQYFDTFNEAIDELTSIFLGSNFDADRDVEFHLYTQANPVVPQNVILEDATSLQNSNWLSTRPTRFVIHGWLRNATSPVIRLIKDSYLPLHDVNVFLVDWKNASGLFYTTAQSKVPEVGVTVAKFMDFLYNSSSGSPNQMYCVGTSLGAHICGFAGKAITYGKISVIFGLDPAGPLYFDSQPENRLTYNDADYVEILHSNSNIMGYGNAIGKADFYVNDGVIQPPCNPVNVSCSHNFAFEVFAESLVTTLGFWGRKCSSFYLTCVLPLSGLDYLFGGEPAIIKPEGIYHFTTKSTSPYAQGH